MLILDRIFIPADLTLKKDGKETLLQNYYFFNFQKKERYS